MSKSLKPFFSFYGGKWRDAVKNYPPPNFETIVEPFAGSAGYSVRYSSFKVVLCEIDPIISGLWRYLISVSEKEILSIPDFPAGGTLDDMKICQEAKWLVGFWLNKGAAKPHLTPSKWMRGGTRPKSFWSETIRNRIANQVSAIRHWKIYECSYEQCPVIDQKATWFVDPPYQKKGKYYRFGSKNINYNALSKWCISRTGQTIVCENAGATWLPFCSLVKTKTTRNTLSDEVVWTQQESTNYTWSDWERKTALLTI